MDLEEINRAIELKSVKRDALNAELKQLADTRALFEAEEATASLVAGLTPDQLDAIYASLTQRVGPAAIPSEEAVGGF